MTRNSFGCMEQCAVRQWDGEGCNAWKYDQESKVCEMGEVLALVDTDNTGVLVMVMETILDTLPLTCHGGEHCCSRDWSRRTHASMVHGGATEDNAWLPGGVAFHAGSKTSDAYGSCARMANATPCEGALPLGDEEEEDRVNPQSSSTCFE